ncbi:MAG: hypothetical protein ABIN00_03405 [candidate division WOR-3 bacterium]
MRKILIFFIISLNLKIFSSDFLSILPTPVGEGGKGAVLTFSSSRLPLFYFNPSNSSNMFGQPRKSFVLFYEHKFLFSNISDYNNFSFLLPEIKGVNFGFQVLNQNINDIPIYPEYSDSVSFVPEGFFSDNCFAGIFNFSYRTNGHKDENFYEWSFGGNIKSLYQKLYTNRGIGFGIDLGITVKFSFDHFKSKIPGIFSFSFVYKDVAKTRIVWDTDSNTVNLIKDRFFTALSYSIDIHKIKSNIFSEVSYDLNDKKLMTSLIYTYSNIIGFNIGYNQNLFERSDIKNTGFGVFLNILNGSIYYSLSIFEIGNTNSIGISYLF